MSCVSAAPVMPEPLADFPWADDVHMWETGHYYRNSYMVRIWYPCQLGQTAQEYFQAAWSRHMEIWRWCEERALLTELPGFETDGMTGVNDEGKQGYARIAAFGKFTVQTPS